MDFMAHYLNVGQIIVDSNGVVQYGPAEYQPPQEDDEIIALRSRIAQLEDAIRTHRSQKADDRCIADDDRLYEALGDGIKCDRRVGDKEAMLRNCERFIGRRCEGGGWPTYVELEARIKALEEALRPFADFAGHFWRCRSGGAQITFWGADYEMRQLTLDDCRNAAKVLQEKPPCP